MAEEFDKLVRDEIPALIRENGETPETHVAEGEEYTDRLLDKLDEEVAEYRESREPAELADVLEVVHALGGDSGLSETELREIRAEKADERGRFEAGIVLEAVRDDTG